VALVPVVAVTFVLFFCKLVLPFFVLLAVFYVLWTFYIHTKYSKDIPVCISRVRNSTGRVVAVGNVFALAAFTYTLATVSGEWSPTILVISAFVGISSAWLNTFAIYGLVMPNKPHGVGFPKTGARDERGEFRRSLEDLVDVLDMCSGWLPFKLRALVCGGDLEAAGKTSEGWPLMRTA
jgi:hypothetical protein